MKAKASGLEPGFQDTSLTKVPKIWRNQSEIPFPALAGCYAGFGDELGVVPTCPPPNTHFPDTKKNTRTKAVDTAEKQKNRGRPSAREP